MNEQPETSLWRVMQKSFQSYLKEELWPGLWLILWCVLWFHYYSNTNPFNSSDQLILVVVSLLVLMNLLRECRVRINNILFLSATWLMLIFGALLPNQSYDWIQPVLGFSAFLFLVRILFSRKEFMDDIAEDGQIDEVTVEQNGESGVDSNNDDKQQ